MYYIDASGAYYEGDQQPNSIKVPQRPSPNHKWDGSAWQLDAKADALAQIAAEEAHRMAEEARVVDVVRPGEACFAREDVDAV